MNNDYPLNALGFSHRFMAEHIKAGGTCIDATAGRGRDTVFLCSLVGENGSVTAFDIQNSAIEQTNACVSENGFKARVICDCHSNMAEYFSENSVDGIMFNLGRLPYGDPEIFSKPETTIKAIGAGLRLLKKGGVMSICVYCGGENGYDERDALREYIKTIDNKKFEVITLDFPNRRGDFPTPIFIVKI